MSTLPNPVLHEDRLRWRERPAGAHAFYQEWHHLLFLHWEIDPAVIQALLPPGLTVDTWEGRAYIGVVPFYMRHIRPAMAVSVPGISFFLELNVRTYVYDRHGTPGVWFISLDANQRLAVYLARRFFHLPYVHSRMRATRLRDVVRDGVVDYRCARAGGGEPALYRYRTDATVLATAIPGTLDFFLVERYLLFSWDAARRRLLRGAVHHAPYEIAPAQAELWSVAPLAWNGHDGITSVPVHQVYSPGVRVDVFNPVVMG